MQSKWIVHKQNTFAIRDLTPWFSSAARLEKATEKLRSAKLAIFKMAFSRDSILPASSYKPTGEAIEWQEKSVEEIIDAYRQNKT